MPIILPGDGLYGNHGPTEGCHCSLRARTDDAPAVVLIESSEAEEATETKPWDVVTLVSLRADVQKALDKVQRLTKRTRAVVLELQDFIFSIDDLLEEETKRAAKRARCDDPEKQEGEGKGEE